MLKAPIMSLLAEARSYFFMLVQFCDSSNMSWCQSLCFTERFTLIEGQWMLFGQVVTDFCFEMAFSLQLHCRNTYWFMKLHEQLITKMTTNLYGQQDVCVIVYMSLLYCMIISCKVFNNLYIYENLGNFTKTCKIMGSYCDCALCVLVDPLLFLWCGVLTDRDFWLSH